MPYYLEIDDRELLKRLRLTNVCAECGGGLEPLYNVEWHLPYLQCKANPEHEGIAKEYREPRELNIPTRREIMNEQYGKEKSTALDKARLPMTGALTQPQAMHILKLVYPDVPEDQIIRTAILCRDFALHPLMKEVYIIGFKNSKTGKTDYSTVIGIAANRKMAANKKGAFSFLDDSPRAASPEEIIKQYGKGSEEDRDNLISVCKLRGEKGNEAIGFGLWPKAKEPYGTDKGNTKRNMSNIRSERQALDRLPGEALPLRDVEVIDVAYANVPDVGKVSKKTGEILEGEFTDVKQEPKFNNALEADAHNWDKRELLESKPKEHWCEEHHCAYELKKSRYGDFYAHKIEGGWCNEKKKKQESKAGLEPLPLPEQEVQEVTFAEVGKVEDVFTLPDEMLKHLKETMQLCNWSATEIGKFCNAEKGWNIREFKDLKPEQIQELILYLQQNPK